MTAKADLLDLLKASFAYCDPLFAKGEDAPNGQLMFLLVHDQRMVGALETYLQMKGL